MEVSNWSDGNSGIRGELNQLNFFLFPKSFSNGFFQLWATLQKKIFWRKKIRLAKKIPLVTLCFERLSPWIYLPVVEFLAPDLPRNWCEIIFVAFQRNFGSKYFAREAPMQNLAKKLQIPRICFIFCGNFFFGVRRERLRALFFGRSSSLEIENGSENVTVGKGFIIQMQVKPTIDSLGT